MKTLDVRGLACPEPVLTVRRELEEMVTGTLQVMVNSGAAKDNITFMAKNLGWEIDVTDQEDYITLTLKK
ncbi:sulfurtransferase TusA family protein [Thermincola potens]|uniref:SirA family protein n=1 Tax=Thermincola potens (strain JR) TaxID=635013 RepID=D5XAN0_THEPJ|nr:sulfurtransferase TusA family protein [Thermincola potens]ADG83234.1 SirA family protein [Thermincola potens JR]